MKTFLALILLLSSRFLVSQTAIILQPDPAEGKDATIFSLDAGGNFGSDIEFIASSLSYPGGPGTNRGLIQFDLSGIPNGAGIIDARLSLYYNDISPSPGQIGHNASYLRRITEDWDENTVSWAFKPNYSTVNQVYIPESTSTNQDYDGINVAPLIRDMLDDPGHSFGFMFMGETEAIPSSMKFFSSDATLATKRPKLEITFTTQPVDCITLQPGSGGTDAKIFSQESEGNFGNDVDIIAAAWTFGGSDGVMRSIFDFDLTALPNNVFVTSASLSLFYNETSSSPGQSGSNESLLQRVTAPWNELTLSWGDQPATTATHQVVLPISTSTDQDYENINITDLIRDQINDPSNSYGFMLRLATEENFRSIKFASSDHADDSKWPKLEICYTLGTASKEIHFKPLSISPNPFQNNLTLVGLEGNFNITIADLNGKTVFSSEVHDVQDQIRLNPLDDLSPGIYFVKAIGPTGNYCGKVVKTY